MIRKIIISFILGIASNMTLANNPKKFFFGDEAFVYTYKFDGNKYLVLKFTEKNNSILPDDVVFKIKFSDNTILRLEGKKENAVFLVGHLKDFSKLTGGESLFFQDRYVKFLINDQQINMLKKKIKAIVINTLPEIYTINTKEGIKEGLLYEGLENTKDEFEE